MKYKSDVCIVGAGPGGSLLAYLLAKQNISVILLERNHSIAKEFRGEHLNEDGENILKKHQLFSKIEEKGLLYMKQVEYWNNGHLFEKIVPEPDHFHLGIHVPQKNLLTVLIEEANKYDHFQLMLDSKVNELIQDHNGRYTGVIAEKNGEEILIESSLIIGADGRFSTIRKKAQIPVHTIHHGYDLLWAKVPAPDNWEPSIKMAVANGTQLSLFTQAGGYVQIGWNIEEGTFPALRKQPFEPFIEQLITSFPELEHTVKQHIRSWQDFVLLKVISCQCATWVKDGLVIMGDAAHTMSPTGAYGLNCSLKDADMLAELINKSNPNQEKLKQQFEQIQRVEVEKLQQMQLDKERSFTSKFSLYM
jgi:2-polyprenyl-6-methoxyphenol hydroxylase-like FAD-dependent oxidoreductase